MAQLWSKSSHGRMSLSVLHVTVCAASRAVTMVKWRLMAWVFEDDAGHKTELEQSGSTILSNGIKRVLLGSEIIVKYKR